MAAPPISLSRGCRVADAGSPRQVLMDVSHPSCGGCSADRLLTAKGYVVAVQQLVPWRWLFVLSCFKQLLCVCVWWAFSFFASLIIFIYVEIPSFVVWVCLQCADGADGYLYHLLGLILDCYDVLVITLFDDRLYSLKESSMFAVLFSPYVVDTWIVCVEVFFPTQNVKFAIWAIHLSHCWMWDCLTRNGYFACC
jgi:hypothetical protein